jgi:hypothetical protein
LTKIIDLHNEVLNFSQKEGESLEKYRSVIGYSLKDMKGISPSLCTHRIPMEQEHMLVREHQRWLNNVMREVVRKGGVETT